MSKEVRTSEKLALTIPDAAQLFSIGEQKLKQLIEANPGAKFWFYNGNRAMILRDEFVKYLTNVNSI